MARQRDEKCPSAAIAAFIAIVRQLEGRLATSEDPAQYVRILELGTTDETRDREAPALQ